MNEEELSLFYKDYLDRNLIPHKNFNNEWWKDNFTIIGMELKFKFGQFLKKFQGTKK